MIVIIEDKIVIRAGSGRPGTPHVRRNKPGRGCLGSTPHSKAWRLILTCIIKHTMYFSWVVKAQCFISEDKYDF